LLVLLCAAQLMVILDISAVNVALPSLSADLGIGPGDLEWTITAYSLLFGSLLLLGGRAADLLGRRRVFLGGLALFTGASAVAALLYALAGASDAGWGSARTLGFGGAGLAGLALFAALEGRTARPLVRLGALADRAVGGGAALMLLASAVLFGAFLLTSIYLQ